MYMYIIGSDFGAAFFRCISSILLSFQCGNRSLAAYFYLFIYFVIKHSPKKSVLSESSRVPPGSSSFPLCHGRDGWCRSRNPPRAALPFCPRISRAQFSFPFPMSFRARERSLFAVMRSDCCHLTFTFICLVFSLSLSHLFLLVLKCLLILFLPLGLAVAKLHSLPAPYILMYLLASCLRSLIFHTQLLNEHCLPLSHTASPPLLPQTLPYSS